MSKTGRLHLLYPEIERMRAAGETWRGISDKLKERGILTTHDNIWRFHTRRKRILEISTDPTLPPPLRVPAEQATKPEERRNPEEAKKPDEEKKLPPPITDSYDLPRMNADGILSRPPHVFFNTDIIDESSALRGAFKGMPPEEREKLHPEAKLLWSIQHHGLDKRRTNNLGIIAAHLEEMVGVKGLIDRYGEFPTLLKKLR